MVLRDSIVLLLCGRVYLITVSVHPAREHWTRISLLNCEGAISLIYYFELANACCYLSVYIVSIQLLLLNTTDKMVKLDEFSHPKCLLCFPIKC